MTEKNSFTTIKVPPHNLEAEQAILGGIFINNDAVPQVQEIISPDDFYREAHRYILNAMFEVAAENKTVDLITVSSHLTKKNLLEKVGGQDYLESLTDVISTSAGIKYHCEIVRDLSIRRQIIAKSSVIVESCFNSWQNNDEILEEMDRFTAGLLEKRISNDFSDTEAVIKDSFKSIERNCEADGYITGLSTGFQDFDRYTAGLQPSDLIILAARPSVGKTSLALDIAIRCKQPTAIFSLEMSKNQLGIRLLTNESKLDAQKLRMGTLRDTDWTKVTTAASNISKLPIYIDDSSPISVQQMRFKLRKLKKKVGLSLVIIDYLQLMDGKGESRELIVAGISRACKAMAKEFDVPVLLLSQLNRKVEDRPDKRPRLADLRESGAIEQDADVIAFIYRDEMYNKTIEENMNMAEIIIAKHRNGPTGHFNMIFRKECTRFEDFISEDYYSYG